MADVYQIHVIPIAHDAQYVNAEDIPRWMADRLVPILDKQPSLKTLHKRIRHHAKDEPEIVELTEEDWALLDQIWHEISPLARIAVMSASYKQFARYREVFERSPSKPDWELHAEFSNPKGEALLRHGNVHHRHYQDLNNAAAAGQIAILTIYRAPTNRIEPGSMLSVDEARRFLEPRGFELVHLAAPRTPAKLYAGEGFSAEMLRQTTLTRYLALDTWTPLLACLLVSGIQPPLDVSEFPEKGAMSLQNSFWPGTLDPFHHARHILILWNSREQAPARVRPADFVAWCQSKGINTDWLREVTASQAEAAAVHEQADTVSRVPDEAPKPIDSEPTHKGTGTQKRWTDENLAQLVKFHKKNGTKKTAETYQLSGAYVRKLVAPSKEKPRTAHDPFGVAKKR